MSGKERGLFRLIFKEFIASIKPNKHTLIGEDYYGTKYYEIQGTRSLKKNPSRYFIPVNKDDFEQELPVEWEAWLRHRRKHPPSKEEVETNYKLQMIKKQNAAKIDATYSSNKLQESKLPVQNEEHKSFPIYDEYKNDGRDYKIKYKKQR